MNPSSIAQLTHPAALFAQTAATVVAEVRRKLYVPDCADDDVEAEFVALRQRIEAYRPEFCALFASALLERLGAEGLQQMLDGLKTEAAQRYLEVAEHIRLELEQSVPALKQKLTAAAKSALESSAPSPAISRAQQSALSLARAVGIEGALNGLARSVTLQVLLEQGGNATQAQLLVSPEAQRIQGVLLGMLAGFHARLFIRHVGEAHVSVVVAELERKPLRDYVSARTAIRPALHRGLNQLIVRMLSEVL